MRPLFAARAAFVFALLFGVGASSAHAEGILRVAGSGRMKALVTDWVDGARLRAEVGGRGSATGPAALVDGDADVAAMSRALAASELRTLRRHFGEAPLVLEVATDAIVVVVHPSNPLPGLRLNQVAAVFSERSACSKTPPLRSWGQLWGHSDHEENSAWGLWADRRIGAYGYSDPAGAPATFRRAALCGGRFRRDLREQPGAAAVIAAVAESRWAIGFVRRSELAPQVRALPLATTGKAFVLPEERRTVDGSYPLANSLWLVAAPQKGEGVFLTLRTLLAFVVSPEGLGRTRSHGFSPPSRRAMTAIELISAR